MTERGKMNRVVAVDFTKKPITAQVDLSWPRPLGQNAYYGFAGEVVRTILPETEADPANLLLGFLVAFGNSIGRGAHVRVGATRHYTNEFVVMVGPTSTGRKGTGWDQIEELFKQAEQKSQRNEMWTSCIKRGLSTGEGLISQVTPRAGNDEDEDTREVDSRLMVLEAEFARVLTVMNRPDNTLSSIIRGAWETGILSVMTRKDPLSVDDAHVSIIGQITEDELRRHLNATERANGFGNRFMFAMVRRSKSLPFGGKAIDYTKLASRLVSAQEKAKNVDAVSWGSARDIWPKHYDRLTRAKFGMIGALTDRGAPHVLRLAMIYALLDESTRIGEAHLRASLEVWRYCEDSAKYVFGMAIGDDTADTILRELRRSKSLSREQIFVDVFSKNKSRSEISRALSLLEREGLAEREMIKTVGRPREVWRAVNA